MLVDVQRMVRKMVRHTIVLLSLIWIAVGWGDGPINNTEQCWDYYEEHLRQKPEMHAICLSRDFFPGFTIRKLNKYLSFPKSTKFCFRKTSR